MMTSVTSTTVEDLAPVTAWRQRVLMVGGFIQLAFAAFWLVRGSMNIQGTFRSVLAAVSVLLVLAALGYAIRSSIGIGHRPTGPEARRCFVESGPGLNMPPASANSWRLPSGLGAAMTPLRIEVLPE